MRAIFLDRDGVINENRDDYVTSWQQLRFLPGALDSLRQLTLAGYSIFVVTNQAAVGRGLMSATALDDIHRRLKQCAYEAGGRIVEIRACLHRSNEGCSCRKPQPGMLLHLAEKWKIDLRTTYMVGDALTDVASGWAAGCRTILVRTGRGEQELRKLRGGPQPDYVAHDLSTAVDWILALERTVLKYQAGISPQILTADSSL